MRPSEGPDAITSLAAALLRAEALARTCRTRNGERVGGNVSGQSLIGRWRLSARRSAQAAAAAGSTLRRSRLVLAVDQMEELFTTETEPASRALFVRLLSAFAASGFVWVIATIRGDFFHRCGEVPGFSALKDGLSSYELLPPTGAEISQIIREPASAAGLAL